MVNKIIKNKYFPFIVMFVILLLLHMTFIIGWGDDLDYKNMDFCFNLFKTRYLTWSSRTFIEIVLVILLKVPPVVWYIADSFMFVLAAYSISKLFSIKHKWIAIFVVLTFPMYILNSAGWYATTLNYLFPSSLGLFSLIPIKNAIYGIKESKIMYLLYSVSLLFACNHEQMCAILFCFYFVFSIYYFVENHKISPYLTFQFALVILSLIFILTCPGNTQRELIEATRYCPEFVNYNIFDKSILGVIATFATDVFNINILYFCFIILIPICIFNLTKNEIKRFVSLIPASIVISLTFFPNIIGTIFPKLSTFISDLKTYCNQSNEFMFFINFETISFFMLCVLFYLSILFSIYNLFDGKKKWLYSLIFATGLASRFILGFSPTLYASGPRTFTFYYFGIVIITILIIEKYFNEIKPIYCYSIFATCAFLNIYQSIGL